jgi:hypothetical protein
MTISVSKFGTPLPISAALRLMQWPGIFGLYALASGEHCNIATRLTDTIYAIVRPPSSTPALRMKTTGKCDCTLSGLIAL